MTTDPSDEPEPSREQMVAMFWTDETFHDLVFKGSDGVRVPAHRASLATKSRVFRKMLLGEFSEASRDEVEIGQYTGAVLRCLIEYIYTDTTKVLAGIGPGGDLSEEARTEFQLILSLTNAADFFNLPTLSRRAHSSLLNRLTVYPALSFALLEACKDAYPTMPQAALDLAWSNIRSDAINLLHSTASKVTASSWLLEEILKDDGLALDDWKKFELINEWKSTSGSSDTADCRLSTAKEMVEKHVRLFQIDPNLLSTKVDSSSLVTLEQLYEAFKQQALVSVQLSGINFATLDPPALWNSTRSHLLSGNTGCGWFADILKCISPMIAGTVHQWTIKLDKVNNVILGIAKKSETLSLDNYIGSQGSSWGFQHNGNTQHNGSGNWRGLPHFHTGSQVALSLNLLPEGEKSGTLCASVNGGEFFQVFDRLLDHVDEEGFVPAASLSGINKICLISFKKIN